MSISSRITNMETNISNAYTSIHNLGVDLSNVDKNLENLSTKINAIYQAYPKVTATGETISLNDTKYARMDTVVKGNSFQQTYTGKNLLSPCTNFTETVSDVVFKAEDGVYSINGTSSARIDLDKEIEVEYIIKSGDYFHLGNQAINTLMTFSLKCTDNTIISGYGSSVNRIYDLSSYIGKTINKISFGIGNGSTINNSVFKPMIVNNVSTSTDFEPYVGGTASPNPSYPQAITNVTGDVEVLVQNKNLAWNGWAEDFVERVNNNRLAKIETKDSRNCIYYAPNVSYNAYDTRYIFKPKNGFKENTQYTFSFDILKLSTTNRTFAILYTDGTTTNNDIVSAVNTWEKQTVTSVANKTIKYVVAFFTSGETYIDLDTFQVEENTTATTYTPHQEQTYTFPLGTQRMFLGDYLADDGIHHVRGIVEYDGSNDESWVTQNNCFTILITDVKQETTSTNILVLSNYYKGVKTNYRNSIASINNSIGKVIGANTQIAIADNRFSTVADFKTWLSANLITVEYVLAEEEITPYTTAQQTAYNQIKQAFSYDEQTNISGTSDEITPIFQITALKGE